MLLVLVYSLCYFIAAGESLAAGAILSLPVLV